MSDQADNEPLKRSVPLPDYLSDLPNIGFIWGPPRSRAESEQTGVLKNINSLDELVEKANRYLPEIARRKTSGL